MHMNEMYQLCQASICLYSYKIRCLDEWYISEGGEGGKEGYYYFHCFKFCNWLIIDEIHQFHSMVA